jgi:hypothetical protein
MNYNNDRYINEKKEDEDIEGIPQPSRGFKKPDIKNNHQGEMSTAVRSLQSRGHGGCKQYPRG